MSKDLFITAAVSLLFVVSCQQHTTDSEEAEAHSNESTTNEIVIPPAQAQSAGIVTEIIRPSQFNGVIPVGGKILEASGSEATIVATVPGIVKYQRQITEGMPVSQGSILFTISSSKLQDDPAQKALVAYRTAKAEYERAAGLVKEKIVTQSEYNTLKANYETARIAYEAYAGSSASGVAVKSPLGGFVKTCLVKEGDYVSVGQPLMSVTQTRKLYLRANVPERYYSQLSTISSAKFKTAYDNTLYDLRRMNGRLVATGKSSDNGSPYIPVTFEFSNRANVMPGAFVETYLLTTPRQGIISLPITALTDEDGIHFVYVQTDASCYERREVVTGETDGERVEIKSGIKSGERIVTQGATQVRLASASRSIPSHSHQH